MDDRRAPALGGHAALQPRRQPEGKPFHIDGHDEPRPRRHDLVDQPVGKARQARIGGKRGTESHDRQAIHGMRARQSLRRHCRAADTDPLLPAPGIVDGAHQAGG